VTVERAALPPSRLPPSRRRGPAKGDLKERAILETCERLLAEKPLRDISVDELATGAEISRPSFYFYFESKDAVLRALVEDVVNRMYSEAEGWLEQSGDPPEVVISRSIEAGAAQWREHGPVLRAAVQTWGTVPEMRVFWEAIVGRFVAQSAERIEEERQNGDAVPGGPDATAVATALIWMNERCFYTNSLGAEVALASEDLVPTLAEIWLRVLYGEVTPRARA